MIINCGILWVLIDGCSSRFPFWHLWLRACVAGHVVWVHLRPLAAAKSSMCGRGNVVGLTSILKGSFSSFWFAVMHWWTVMKGASLFTWVDKSEKMRSHGWLLMQVVHIGRLSHRKDIHPVKKLDIVIMILQICIWVTFCPVQQCIIPEKISVNGGKW